MLPKELGILETVSFIFLGNTTLLVLENTMETVDLPVFSHY